MKRLPQPDHDIERVFDDCVNTIRREEERGKYVSVKSEILGSTATYSEHGENGSLVDIEASKEINESVGATEMVWLYKNRLAKKGTKARYAYDELLAAPKHKQCPFCGHRKVSTLDHFLPKSEFALFTVTPLNLVPACKDCNHAKGDERTTDAAKLLAHPYFDNFESERWLYASVVQGPPHILSFHVSPPEDWPDVKKQRIRHHFERLELSHLYMPNAAEELMDISDSLGKLFDAGGAEAVKEHLEREAESRKNVNLNSWKTAMYEAIASSDWFCSGDFRDR